MAEYIDRHALKNDGHLCWHDGKGNIYYEVDHAPTADVVEVQHGEWEVYGLMNPQCSLCHKYNYEKSRFCPHCGAKMDGGKNENV